MKERFVISNQYKVDRWEIILIIDVALGKNTVFGKSTELFDMTWQHFLIARRHKSKIIGKLD